MKEYLLTLDYELFGNGSGDVFKHIIEPTNILVDIANKFNAKFTIFFEVVEYWMLKREWDSGNTMGYSKNPIEAMEKQLLELYKNGHDIQLHIHPQWMNSKYENGVWWIDKSLWRLGTYEELNGVGLEELLRRGKQTIEDIIKPYDACYECIALRAGGYNIEPSARVLAAMRRVGLKYDSSVYSGGMEDGKLSKYDFTSVTNNKGWWYVGDDVKNDALEKTDIVELPIVAFPVSRMRKYLNIQRVLSFFKHSAQTKETFEAKTNGGGVFNKMKFMLGKEALTWDFCLLPNALNLMFLKKISKLTNRDVFVLIGHPKSSINEKAFEKLLLRFSELNYKSLTIKDLHVEIECNQ